MASTSDPHAVLWTVSYTHLDVYKRQFLIFRNHITLNILLITKKIQQRCGTRVSKIETVTGRVVTSSYTTLPVNQPLYLSSSYQESQDLNYLSCKQFSIYRIRYQINSDISKRELHHFGFNGLIYTLKYHFIWHQKIIPSNMVYNLSKFHFNTLINNRVILCNLIYSCTYALGIQLSLIHIQMCIRDSFQLISVFVHNVECTDVVISSFYRNSG